MQGAISGALVKRGMDFASKCLKHKQAQAQAANGWASTQNKENPLEEIGRRFQSFASVTTLGLTFVAFLVLTSLFEYAIRIVVTNLAIVESTEDAGRIILTTSHPSDYSDAPLDKKPLMDDIEGIEQTVEAALPAKPITRKLRSTFAHLRSIGGFRARFRGIRYAAFYAVVNGFFTFIFNAVFSFFGPFGFFLATMCSALVTCNIHATWTHATIAAPSDKGFFQRFLSRSVATALIAPTVRVQAAKGLTHLATFGTAMLATNLYNSSSLPQWAKVNVAFLPLAVALLTSVFIMLPAHIALIRKEASLLPEDENTIVPFDRTFGGRVVSVAETAPIGRKSARCVYLFKNFTMRGAYMSFDKETFKRVLKIQVKFVAITMAISAAFVAIFATEAYIIAGGEQNIRKMMEIAREQMKQQ